MDLETGIDADLVDLAGINDQEKRENKEQLNLIKNPMKHTISKDNMKQIEKLLT